MPKPVSQEFIANLGRTIEQGAALHRAGRLNEAENIYARILKSIPDQFVTLQLMAELKMVVGNPAEAYRMMTAALSRSAGAVRPYPARAQARRRIHVKTRTMHRMIVAPGFPSMRLVAT